MSARIMAEARQQQEEVEAEGDPLRQAAAASGGRWETDFISGNPSLGAQLSKVVIGAHARRLLVPVQGACGHIGTSSQFNVHLCCSNSNP
jgi:hypothetical protein